MDRNQTHLQVGTVTRPHGLQGELKVRLHCDESTSLEDVTHVIVELRNGKAERTQIEGLRGSAKGLILRLQGVSSRDAAEAMREAKLWVERTAVKPLGEGEYYLVDLVGCSLEFGGKVIGSVVSVRPDPSVDTMVLELTSGGSAEMPIVDAWVGKVDIEDRRVQLLSTDGIIS